MAEMTCTAGHLVSVNHRVFPRPLVCELSLGGDLLVRQAVAGGKDSHRRASTRRARGVMGALRGCFGVLMVLMLSEKNSDNHKVMDLKPWCRSDAAEALRGAEGRGLAARVALVA